MDFRTIQNAFDKLRTQQGRLAVLQRHIEMLQSTVRKFNSMFVGNKIKDEYLTIEQHERKYEQDLNKQNIVHYNNIYFDLDRNIKANFDFYHSDINSFLGNNLILMSKPNLSGHISDVQIGENCTDISIGNNCSNITIGNNCKNVEIAANNSQINIGNDCSNIVIDESSV